MTPESYESTQALLIRIDERMKLVQEQIADLQKNSAMFVRHKELEEHRRQSEENTERIEANFNKRIDSQEKLLNEKLKPLTWLFYAVLGGLVANTLAVVFSFLAK